ncbi:shikimate kinase [Thermomonas sp.]|uniref:shikimate kinase n=1 Tax=Thermomonas sp. TaxID=1971895 RepID=UPI002488BF56|nr:shikimate kinase [Thermomonas sp.]MDI1251873.1 shikimate kinase [Thermomonas sp.]
MRDPSESPSHIVLVGPMGAGKSSIGRLLAVRLQRAFTDLDACIEAEADTTITAIFASEGEAGFRSRECRALIDALAKTAASVIATGGGAVLNAGNRSAMRDASTVIYLQVEPAMQMQRLAGDDTRPLLATDHPAQQLAELQAMREPLYLEVADIVFDTTQHSPENAAVAMVALLEQASERCV